jgi:hypothetical protein
MVAGAMVPGIKKKKGKKKESQVQPDLNRILGYTGSDVEEPLPIEDEDDEEDEESAEWEGVVDRDYIKLRAMKVTMKMSKVR